MFSKLTKFIRWLLRVDKVDDPVVKEHLEKNRKSLEKQREKWAKKTDR